MKECQHILVKRNKWKKTTFYSFYSGEQVVTCLLIRVICGESPNVNQRLWTKVGHRQLVHPSTPSISSVERNCLHGSLWLIHRCWSTWGTRVNARLHGSLWLVQPCWSTWGTRVNAPLLDTVVSDYVPFPVICLVIELNNSIEQGPFCESNGFSATQKFLPPQLPSDERCWHLKRTF